MCKPAATHTLQPENTNISLDWTGRRRDGFSWRIEIRNGFDGRESARILGCKLRRWLHFGGRWSGWLGSEESCGGRKLICVTWVLEAGLGGGIPARSRRRGRSTR